MNKEQQKTHDTVEQDYYIEHIGMQQTLISKPVTTTIARASRIWCSFFMRKAGSGKEKACNQEAFMIRLKKFLARISKILPAPLLSSS